MTELINNFRNNPKEAIKDALICLSIFVVGFGMVFIASTLQGCSMSRSVSVKGKATIITVDTMTVKHNGGIKFKKSMFN